MEAKSNTATIYVRRFGMRDNPHNLDAAAPAQAPQIRTTPN